ncbi:helix-turn-helix transcriptional regulator [Streptomyces sp. NPDC048550]|uniref:helix-turn-helix domain-containing protein n=1 Tax=Streptomyces sp. NPDC048550 TaxID=3155739 RepID=UPI003442B2DB
MGRPEFPVDRTVRARAELAIALRRCRAEAGLSYDELADMTDLSAGTFKRAAAGKAVPTEETLRKFACTCGVDLNGKRRLATLWLDARIADRGRLGRLQKPALPRFTNGRRELSAALEYFYEAASAPPLRRLTELAGGSHLLPVSSAARIVTRKALPASRQQMIAFLTACGLTQWAREIWAEAFEEITQSHDHAEAIPLKKTAELIRRTTPQSPLMNRGGGSARYVNPEFWPRIHSSTAPSRVGWTA